MTRSVFSLQSHKTTSRNKTKDHWDLRIRVTRSKVWSWAIPKMRLPEGRGDKVLAVWVDDTHTVKYMGFNGRLRNGDQVSVIDYAPVDIIKFTENTIHCHFHGEFMNGSYILVKVSDTSWLLLSKN